MNNIFAFWKKESILIFIISTFLKDPNNFIIKRTEFINLLNLVNYTLSLLSIYVNITNNSEGKK